MQFTRKELEKQLGFTNEQRKLIMSFQRDLPILTEDGDGFCVDARVLHSELGVGRDFSTWIKSRIDKYGFEEKNDYIKTLSYPKNIDVAKFGDVKNMNKNQLSRHGISIEYKLTLDMAKELCMVENNEKGTLARRYFILMEKALKNMIEWRQVRTPEKFLYKEMCSELDKYFQRNFNKRPNSYDYSNEANALNLICLGARAKDILAYMEAQDNQTRDYLLKEYNEYLCKIQELNIMYLKMNLQKEQRYNLLQQGFKVMYPFASFVIANKEKKVVLNN